MHEGNYLSRRRGEQGEVVRVEKVRLVQGQASQGLQGQAESPDNDGRGNASLHRRPEPHA